MVHADGTVAQLTFRQRTQLSAEVQIESGEGLQLPDACKKLQIDMTDRSLRYAGMVHGWYNGPGHLQGATAMPHTSPC